MLISDVILNLGTLRQLHLRSLMFLELFTRKARLHLIQA